VCSRPRRASQKLRALPAAVPELRGKSGDLRAYAELCGIPCTASAAPELQAELRGIRALPAAARRPRGEAASPNLPDRRIKSGPYGTVSHGPGGGAFNSELVNLQPGHARWSLPSAAAYMSCCADVGAPESLAFRSLRRTFGRDAAPTVPSSRKAKAGRNELRSPLLIARSLVETPFDWMVIDAHRCWFLKPRPSRIFHRRLD
jgi:hypothetical protein